MEILQVPLYYQDLQKRHLITDMEIGDLSLFY